MSSNMFSMITDQRVECLSIMTVLTVEKYLQIVEYAYSNKGGIEGQRSKLTTKTAQTIRQRMVDDVALGAVLPPVVIGYLVDDTQYNQISSAENAEYFLKLLSETKEDTLSIIDGMQRTTALKEAIDNQVDIKKNPIRVEFWIAKAVNSLIYRMLVLNTGQVPWEIGRQLETVYSQIIRDVKRKIGEDVVIFSKDDKRRRRQHSQYQSQSVIELFIIFSSRKADVDLRDKISEDFARMDAIDATSHESFLELFIKVLSILTRLDRAFSKFSKLDNDDSAIEKKRITEGRDIFNSFPAMAGFCAAAAVWLFDEPGFDPDWDQVQARLNEIEIAADTVLEKVESITSVEDFNSFLQLDLLNQKLSVKSGQVGRFEREFFKRAFSSMFKNAERLADFAPLWMAH